MKYGYCQCGCGQKTSLYPRNRHDLGIKKGEPRKFLTGHSSRGRKWTNETREKLMCCIGQRNYKGSNNPKWRGGRIKLSDGRIAIYAPHHPKACLFGGTHILEYRLVAEKKIGRYLLDNEIVHHINGDPTDNRPKNLEIMTQSEHAKHESIRRDKITGRYGKKVAA